MLVIGQCNRIVDTSCLCKWIVRVMCVRYYEHSVQLTVFFMQTFNLWLEVCSSDFVTVLINR